jgi:hypothetical protein
MQDYIQQAVDRVNDLYKKNDWPYRYCVGMVSKNSKIDFGTLMSACGRRRRKRKKFKNPQEIYGNKQPYWLKD